MATERRDNSRSTQTGLPIMHFYEQFVKTHQKKQGDPHNQSMEMVQLSKASRRRRQRSVFSDRHPEEGRSHTSANPLALRKIVVSDRETRPSHTESPVSPLTPPTSFPLMSTSKTRISRVSVETNTDTRQDSKATRNITRNPRKGPQTKTDDTAKRLTVYERSKLRLQEREKKLQKVRDEMMQECTFRPKISKQSPAISKAKHNITTPHGFVGGFSGLSVRKGNTMMQKKIPIVSSDIRTPDSNTEATTPTTTSTSKQYWQRKQQQRQHPGISASVSKDESCVSKTTNATTKSFRFEELYQDGVRKARQRPATEKAEQEMRRKRLEDEQLKECTFKPKLYWGNKVQTNRRKPLVSASSVTSNRTLKSQGGHRSQSPRHARVSASKKKSTRTFSQRNCPIPNIDPITNINISPIQTGIQPIESMDSPAVRRTAQKDKTMMPPLPVEITTTIPTSVEPASPVRRIHDWKARLYSRGSAVSPLRGPTLGVEIDREPEDSPMAPRVIFCGTTVGGESVAEQTQRTDYGSI